jgi:hypothetical protein
MSQMHNPPYPGEILCEDRVFNGRIFFEMTASRGVGAQIAKSYDISYCYSFWLYSGYNTNALRHS